MVVPFVTIGGIVDHHCLEMVVTFVTIDGIVDHHCFNFIFIAFQYNMT
jgi:hypothetical protein